jgi:hypothetical protein
VSGAPLQYRTANADHPPMRTGIRVRCIAPIEEAPIAIQEGADALGLVGSMPSGPGPIDDGLIAEIPATAPLPVSPFLQTSETTAETITNLVRRRLTPAPAKRLPSRFPELRLERSRRWRRSGRQAVAPDRRLLAAALVLGAE